MKNIQLISASAGSGKTYRLMDDIAKRVCGKNGHKVVAPEHIMATTFTNKAAAELKERIRMRLLDENKPGEAQRIYDGLIGTVNSICSRLLKEYAFEAGLSPAVDVLLEEDASRIFNMATSQAIDESGKTLEPIAKRLGLMGYGNGFSKQADWRDYVRDVVNLARSNAMTEQDLINSAQASWEALESLLGKSHGSKMGVGSTSRLNAAVTQAIADIKANVDDQTAATKKVISTLQSVERKFSFNAQYVSWEDWLGLSGLAPGAKSKAYVEKVNAIAEDHIKHPAFHADLKAMIEGVFECASKALGQYATYKAEQGLMDFVDQEALVLKMATENDSFQASIKERVKLLMVDEFQDTSPIQLALFLRFSELAEEVIWVGDQKQSIYGFRGADPVLMDAVAEEIGKQATASSVDNVLKDSWRSKKVLVDFCNAIFTPVFHQTDSDKVALNIPEKRKDSAQGGWLESWTVEGSNAEKRSSALVSGIQQVMADRKVKAGDIAVLCKSNNECEAVSASLNAAGVRASIAQGDLLATHECTLALAALRYMTDQKDSIAMAEIVCYSSKHTGHQDWMKNLIEAPEATKEVWQQDAIMLALKAVGKKAVYLTPLESLAQAIESIDLERTIYAWGNVSRRMSNVDQLRAACVEYQDRCKSRRGSATVTGFLTWITSEAELKQAESSGEDTVNVLTYHKSKGLEWPVVIMSSLNKGSRSGVFGVSVSEAATFKAEDPLAGRTIRFWPWPYGMKKKADQLDACLEGSAIVEAAKDSSLLESQRVLYVGLTRARDGLVLTQEKPGKAAASHKWLDELINEDKQSVLSFEEDSFSIQGKDGKTEAFDAKERVLTASEDDILSEAIQDEVRYLPKLYPQVEYPAARIAPSSVDWASLGEPNDKEVSVSLEADLGERLKMTGAPEMSDFGNAIHGFLGADLGKDEASRMAQADALLANWKVEGSIAAWDMLLASDRLNQYLNEHYPKAKVLTEWPMEMTLDNQQQMQGWLDMLLELPEGYVVIDHKSYPGGNAAEHAKQYAPQLAVYKKAVEQATGKPVLKTLIHMPLVGEVFEVSFA